MDSGNRAGKDIERYGCIAPVESQKQTFLHIDCQKPENVRHDRIGISTYIAGEGDIGSPDIMIPFEESPQHSCGLSFSFMR